MKTAADTPLVIGAHPVPALFQVKNTIPQKKGKHNAKKPEQSRNCFLVNIGSVLSLTSQMEVLEGNHVDSLGQLICSTSLYAISI